MGGKQKMNIFIAIVLIFGFIQSILSLLFLVGVIYVCYKIYKLEKHINNTIYIQTVQYDDNRIGDDLY